jgi:serine/threonine protein kinase
VMTSKILNEIPFSRNYFVLIKGDQCEPSAKSLEIEPGLKECDIIASRGLASVKAVRMQFAGTPLYKYRFSTQTFDIWTFGTKLLEAVTMLTTHGIIHSDLHSANILIDNYGVPRIIDFGQTIIKRNSSASDVANALMYKYDPRYVQQPPELSVYHAMYEKRNIETILHDIIERKKTFSTIYTTLNVTKEELYEGLSKFVVESDSVQKVDLKDYFNHYWTKIDAWSIGGVLLSLLNKMLHIGYETHPSYTRNRLMIRDVIRKLLDVDPRRRYDAVDALEEWNPSSIIFHKYGKPWQQKKVAKPT